MTSVFEQLISRNSGPLKHYVVFCQYQLLIGLFCIVRCNGLLYGGVLYRK